MSGLKHPPCPACKGRGHFAHVSMTVGSLADLAQYDVLAPITCARCSGRGYLRCKEDCDVCLGDKLLTAVFVPGDILDGASLELLPLDSGDIPCLVCSV